MPRGTTESPARVKQSGEHKPEGMHTPTSGLPGEESDAQQQSCWSAMARRWRFHVHLPISTSCHSITCCLCGSFLRRNQRCSMEPLVLQLPRMGLEGEKAEREDTGRPRPMLTALGPATLPLGLFCPCVRLPCCWRSSGTWCPPCLCLRPGQHLDDFCLGLAGCGGAQRYPSSPSSCVAARMTVLRFWRHYSSCSRRGLLASFGALGA